MVIKLLIDKDVESYLSYNSFDNSLNFYVDSYGSLCELIENIDLELEEVINDEYSFLDDKTINELYEIGKKIKNDKIIFNDLEVSYIPSDFQDIINLINNECVIDFCDFDDDKLLEVLNKYNYKDNFLFKYKYNKYEDVSLDLLRETLLYLKEIKKYVSYYKMSPLEVSIFVYDLLREREYVKVIDDDGRKVGRDLSQIIKREEIVCVGYANLFSNIMNGLGVKTESIVFEPINDGENGHMSNICYLSDLVYGIHGVYEYDVTFGTKDSNNNYLDNYNDCAIPLDWAFKLKEIGGLVLENRLPFDLEKYIENKNISLESGLHELIVSGYKMIFKRILRFMNAIGIDDVALKCKQVIDGINCYSFEELESFILEFREVIDKCKKEIEMEKFISALYNVRRVEHSIDRFKYPLSIDIIRDIVNNRVKFRSKLGFDSAVDKLLSLINEKKTISLYSLEDISSIINSNLGSDEKNMDRDILRMELIDVLHDKIKDDKGNPAMYGLKYRGR